MKFLKENKKAVLFLVLFVVVYLVLNTLYSMYIRYYEPSSDIFTRVVTGQVVWLLSFFDPSIAYFPSSLTAYIPVANDHQYVIYVFEGCNGLNVMIVYVSFMTAFGGLRKSWVVFVTGGVLAIHAVNLLRIALLYYVASHFPEQLYFFHKYFFTGVIYVIVFVLWYFWIRQVKAEDGK